MTRKNKQNEVEMAKSSKKKTTAVVTAKRLKNEKKEQLKAEKVTKKTGGDEKTNVSGRITKRTWAGMIYTAISALIILGGTYLVVRWAQGDFRINKTDGTLSAETGLLSANSAPTGASVFIDGKLITATDDVIYLNPGTYEVAIVKDGYNTWKKNITVEKSLVAQTDALLIPTTPSLASLTYTGAENLSVSPDGLKIVFYTASASAKTKNGLYVLDLNSGLLSSNPKLPSQITDNDPEFDLAKAEIIWSSDSNQILLKTGDNTFLLSVYEKSTLASQPDVSLREESLLTEWQADMADREQQFLSQYPEEVLAIATGSAENVYLAPNKKKLLYTATESATLSPGLVSPAPIVTNTQAETRELVPNGIYIYDLIEDRNYLLGFSENEESAVKSLISREITVKGARSSGENNGEKGSIATESGEATEKSSVAMAMINDLIDRSDFSTTVRNFEVYHSSMYADTYQWLADSKNLIRVKDGAVEVISYDGTNEVVLYAGNLAESFLYPWPDGSKLLILTSFSPETPNNIYYIDLK